MNKKEKLMNNLFINGFSCLDYKIDELCIRLETIYQMEKDFVNINNLKEFWLFLNLWFNIDEIASYLEISTRSVYRISDYIMKLDNNNLLLMLRCNKSLKNAEKFRVIIKDYLGW